MTGAHPNLYNMTMVRRVYACVMRARALPGRVVGSALFNDSEVNETRGEKKRRRL